MSSDGEKPADAFLELNVPEGLSLRVDSPVKLKPPICKSCSWSNLSPSVVESTLEIDDSEATTIGFWDSVYTAHNLMLTRYVTSEFRKSNAFATSIFKNDLSPSQYTEKKVNLGFTLRLVQRAWIRISNLSLDIFFMVLAENEADGIRTWVFWTLLSLRILPVPVILHRHKLKSVYSFITILSLSSSVQLYRSVENGEWTDELIKIDIIEAFLTTLPSAIIQLFVLITQVEADTSTWIITALATSFSVVSAASKLSGVEFLVFGITLKSCGELVRSCIFSMYCIIDVTLSTIFIAVCIENFNSSVFHYIPWGCVLLLFRYISRFILHLAIYCWRGSIKRWGSSTSSSIMAFAGLAGLVEWLTGLFFIHEIVMQGALSLFALQLLGTLELAAMVICIYKDEESVLHNDHMYVIFCLAGLQLTKWFLILTKRYPTSIPQKKSRKPTTLYCSSCGKGAFVHKMSTPTSKDL